jgi:hypothetical protein
MNAKEYAATVQRGTSLSQEPAGLFARVIQQAPGQQPIAEQLLASATARRTAFVSGGDALLLFSRVPATEFLLRMGKSREWLHRKKAANWELFLLVFEASEAFHVEPATWDGVQALVSDAFRSVADRLEPHWPTLRSRSLEQIVGTEWRRFDQSDVKENPAHPEHVSEATLLSRTITTAADARLFLWHTVGINEHFTGDGFTANDGVRGFREYLARNVPIRALTHETIAIPYDID